QLEEALGMAKTAVSADSTRGAYWDTLGWIYFKLGDYDAALTYILKSIELRDASAEVLDHLGDIYAKLGDFEKAQSHWQEALEKDPGNTQIQRKLAQGKL
ncbi:MAG: tetratricopeptide repeat protein, partial [bacterium]